MPPETLNLSTPEPRKIEPSALHPKPENLNRPLSAPHRIKHARSLLLALLHCCQEHGREVARGGRTEQEGGVEGGGSQGSPEALSSQGTPVW